MEKFKWAYIGSGNIAKSTKECMRIMDECRRQMNLIYPFEK